MLDFTCHDPNRGSFSSVKQGLSASRKADREIVNFVNPFFGRSGAENLAFPPIPGSLGA